MFFVINIIIFTFYFNNSIIYYPIKNRLTISGVKFPSSSHKITQSSMKIILIFIELIILNHNCLIIKEMFDEKDFVDNCNCLFEHILF